MKNKTMAMILAGAITALGATGQVRADDRINLWPLIYDDGDGTYVAWPLMRFSDSSSSTSWIFPVFWENDFFCIFPEVWLTRRATAILPFIFDNKGRGFAIFPLWWNEWDGNDTTSCLFPAYYYCGDERRTHFWSMAGLMGYWRDGREDTPAHWLLPLYAKNDDGFYSLPYTHTKRGDYFLCGLAGHTRGKDSASWMFPLFYQSDNRLLTPLFGSSGDKSWVIPLFYKDKDEFFSLPYSRNKTCEKYLLGLAGRTYGDAGDASWLFPLYFKSKDMFLTPLFGWTDEYSWAFPFYYRDGEGFYSFPYTRTKTEERFLLGLAGRTFGEKGDSKWLFPLFYQNEDTIISPLFGMSGDSSWVIPLYYKDKHGTFTLPVAWGRDELNSRYVSSLPLLSYCKWNEKNDNYEWAALGGLAGGGKSAYSSANWLFPLYARNKGYDSSMFATLLFGRDSSPTQTNTWWATPLVGTKSGEKNGGWLFPLFSHTEDAKFDRQLGWLDAKTLPEELNIRYGAETNTTYVAEDTWATNVVERFNADSFRSDSDTDVLIVSGVESTVYGFRDHDRVKNAEGRETDIYSMCATRESGNIFVFKKWSSRSVDFDLKTRKRMDETEYSHSSTSFLMFLYNSEQSKSPKGSYSRSQVLWKIWDREERDGNVTVDAFPGFTYDSNTNGYTKTSFLWRFFRYEKDPEKNSTAVDLFFIPIWR